MPIKLGVNIDHVATLRQVRGGQTDYPSILKIAEKVLKSGGDQITVHLREDRRHIQDRDVIELIKAEIGMVNLEMACTDSMIRFAKKYRPDWVCFVPEKRQELTTEGGLDVVSIRSKMQSAVEKLQPMGIEVSLFIDPDEEQVRTAYEVGADAVEFHTGSWVSARSHRREKLWKKLVYCAELAHFLGLRVHAGHGLDYERTADIRHLPYLAEVNIGHSIVCYSIDEGIAQVTRKMKKILNGRALL